jgi:ATP-dependent protease ClpP protease subunit
MNERWIQFAASVNQNTSSRFIQAITQCLNEGATKLNILISTPGGTVIHGKGIYNFLAALPVEIDVYNIGQVDSIGGIMYLAGANRYATENSSFLIHAVALQVGGAASFQEKLLQEKIDSLKQDRESIAIIYADRTGISLEDFETLMLEGTTISANDAVVRGVVTEVKSPSIPVGTQLISVTD